MQYKRRADQMKITAYDFAETKTDNDGNNLFSNIDEEGNYKLTIDGIDFPINDNYMIVKEPTKGGFYILEKETFNTLYSPDKVFKYIYNRNENTPVDAYMFCVTKVDKFKRSLYDGSDDKNGYYINYHVPYTNDYKKKYITKNDMVVFNVLGRKYLVDQETFFSIYEQVI